MGFTTRRNRSTTRRRLRGGASSEPGVPTPQLQSESLPPPPRPGFRPRPKTTSIPIKTPTTRRFAAPEGEEGKKKTSRTERKNAAPKKPSNPLPLIAGVGGGALLLIIVIAVAASGGDRPDRAAREAKAPVPVARQETSSVTKQDTGPITFACINSGSHPDEEKMVQVCPKCGGRAPFFHDYKTNKFSCWNCKALFNKEDFSCPDCGKKPEKTPYIKHRPN